MSDYPEHDKQAQVVEQTQAIGEFLDWLSSQGVNLMIWREDPTDSRVTDPKCGQREGSDRHAPLACKPSAVDETSGEYHWRAHCMHWNDPEREADENEQQGTCCYCGKGRFYEITGLKSWVSEPRSIMQLLADWAGIDLKKIEVEKRQMLAAIRSATEVV